MLLLCVAPIDHECMCSNVVGSTSAVAAAVTPGGMVKQPFERDRLLPHM